MEWSVSPIALEWGPISLRWYGLLFMGGFLGSYLILKKIFVKESVPLERLDELFTSIFLGTLIGARLGHVLFYEPVRYFTHPLEIFAIWHGGLASHGGVIGIAVALLLYVKRHPEVDCLWLFDRIGLVAPLAGAFIRFGNLMNSEMIGKQTDLPWAIVFTRLDHLPRHPTQIYEALSYLLIFGFLWAMHSRAKLLDGVLFGWMLILVFSVRIFVEFFKENQAAFESALPVNLGQILSIPFVIVGMVLVRRAAVRSQTK